MEDCDSLARFLSRLVSIPTPNDPARNIRPGYREAEAIADTIVEITGVRYEILDGPAPVLLRIAGSGRPVVLFLAHYDVVPPGPGWTVPPYEGVVKDGKLYGRGAADDKSNVSAISYGLAGFEPGRGTVVIAFTGDEETGGRSAAWLAGWLRDNGYWPDYLVNGDGSLSRIITRRRSAFRASISVRPEKVEVKGAYRSVSFETRFRLRKTMHSAYFIPGVDTHALVLASLWVRDSDALVSGLDGEWVKGNVVPRSVNVTAVVRGDDNVIVDYGLTRLVKAIIPVVRAPVSTEMYSDYGVTINPNVYSYNNGFHEIVLDIRAMTSSKSRIEEALSYVLDNTLGPGQYELRVRGGSGFLYTKNDSTIVGAARRVARSLGLPDAPIEGGGASDSRHFSPKGVEAIDFGPLGFNIHGPDEHVLLDHLCTASRFYRLIAETLLGGEA